MLLKKIFVVLLVLLSISACTVDPFSYSPGIEDSSLPADFLVQKAREAGIEYPQHEVIVIEGPSRPSGDYILLTVLYQGGYQTAIHLDGKQICIWEEEITYPLQYREEFYLLFTPDNCPGLQEEIVWNSTSTNNLSVWILYGSEYTQIR